MRLLSYNIHNGIGGIDRRYKLERVWRVIEDEQPDLVCLQEVASDAWRTKYHDQPDFLANRFQPRDLCFQMNVRYRRGGYGNLLLSRWAFRWQRQVSLRMQTRKPRGAQIALIDTPEGPLHLTNWHLGLAERERHWQVAHLLNHTDFAAEHNVPSLVVGDFNDWRNTLAAGSFAQHGFKQVTAPPKRFRSFPAFLPTLSLDKAFFRGAVTIREVRVVRSRHALWASDHLPLVIDFGLRENTTSSCRDE